MKFQKTILFVFMLFCIPLFNSCVKKSEPTKTTKEKDYSVLIPYEQQLLEEEKEEELELKEKKEAIIIKKKAPLRTINSELDFIVKNLTGRPIFVTCFSYIQKHPFNRWRWDKSAIYELQNNESTIIDIDTIPEEQNIKNTYGFLAVFNTQKEAINSTYELLDDKKKIDLDLIKNLKDHKVLIGVEKYGFKGDILDLNIVPLKNGIKKVPELDFVVENKMGKTVYITCFVYQKKKDMPVWQYDKTEVKKLKPNQLTLIDVDTISKSYNRVYTRGFLAIFDKKEKAKNSIYELLEPRNKISLGRLESLKKKKVILKIEKYGLLEDFIDFSVKPSKRIKFGKRFK